MNCFGGLHWRDKLNQLIADIVLSGTSVLGYTVLFSQDLRVA
jgi:hypothetical protein